MTMIKQHQLFYIKHAVFLPFLKSDSINREKCMFFAENMHSSNYLVCLKQLKKCRLCSKEFATDKQLACFVGCSQVGFRTMSAGGGSAALLCFQILWTAGGAEMWSKVFIQEELLWTILKLMSCYTTSLHTSA